MLDKCTRVLYNNKALRKPVQTTYADLAHLVERHLAKVEVASSSLVIRSIMDVQKALKTLFKRFLISVIRRHSQVVRQRSAKPLCPSSNLGGASKVKTAAFLSGCFFVSRRLSCAVISAARRKIILPGRLDFSFETSYNNLDN